MASWPSKDPDAVKDYVYRIPLDAGDSVSGQPTVTVLAGSIAIDNDPGDLAAAPDTTDEGYGQDLTLIISGGDSGETGVVRVAWQTAQGRIDDDVVTLPIFESDLVPLVLTDYAKPAPGHLTVRYPAFADVPASTIQFWLTDAERSVDSSWMEGDYAAGLMALAAHNMALAGLGSDVAATASIPAGVSRFKSGSFEAAFTDAAANARSSGSLDATRYGMEFKNLLRRNRGGPLVTSTGTVPYDPTRYPQGEE